MATKMKNKQANTRMYLFLIHSFSARLTPTSEVMSSSQWANQHTNKQTKQSNHTHTQINKMQAITLTQYTTPQLQQCWAHKQNLLIKQTLHPPPPPPLHCHPCLPWDCPVQLIHLIFLASFIATKLICGPKSQQSSSPCMHRLDTSQHQEVKLQKAIRQQRKGRWKILSKTAQITVTLKKNIKKSWGVNFKINTHVSYARSETTLKQWKKPISFFDWLNRESWPSSILGKP